MKASVVDLRYRMKDVLSALRRNEAVDILYYGKIAGTIFSPKKTPGTEEIKKHPFFGMHKKQHKNKPVEAVMNELRGGRYRAL